MDLVRAVRNKVRQFLDRQNNSERDNVLPFQFVALLSIAYNFQCVTGLQNFASLTVLKSF